MREILDLIETPYVDAQTLLAHLTDYQNPRDWIARMVKKGELIRIKNGFYLIASRFMRGKVQYPYEQISNLLYGPSYISMEWAMSFYSFIPERVSVITSVTTGKNKEFYSPIGTFSYLHLNFARYSVGITRKTIINHLGGFLIASPEKALSDWVFFTCKDLNKKELLTDLVESKRIEKENLQSLNQDLLIEISRNYRSNTIQTLVEVIKSL